jgi:WD40 repeat protein
VAFAPDGQTVAAGTWENVVRLWRVTDGTLLHTLAGHQGRVFGVAFSPDGQTLASTGEDGRVRLWRVADGTAARTLTAGDWALDNCSLQRPLQELLQCRLHWHPYFAYDAAFAPDSRHLAFADGLNVRLQPLR